MEKRSVAGAPRILDGHNDVLLELSRGGRGFLGRDDTGHVDLPRALEGGFGGGLFACFIPNPEEEWDMGTALTITGTGYEVAMAPPLNPSYAREMADLQIAELFRIEAGHDEPDTPLEVLVNHVDYLVGRLGIGGVAFGSDFDGATMAREIGDVSGLPHLLAALRERGYGEDALRKLAHENWLRVLAETWRK